MSKQTFMCSSCGKIKPLEEQSNDGGVCKQCYEKEQRDYFEEAKKRDSSKRSTED